MAQKVHKNHIRRRKRVEAPVQETTVYPDNALRTESGFVVDGYKGNFETQTEQVNAGGVSTIRCHDTLPRVYRVESGYCLFIMIDKNTGHKTEVVGSPGKEILVPEGYAHYIKGHVQLNTSIFIVQEKDFLDNFVEEANSATVKPFDEAIHNHTPQIPAPRLKGKKSKASEQNKKMQAQKGHVSAANANSSGLSGLMKTVTQQNFKVDNQRPTILSRRDLPNAPIH